MDRAQFTFGSWRETHEQEDSGLQIDSQLLIVELQILDIMSLLETGDSSAALGKTQFVLREKLDVWRECV